MSQHANNTLTVQGNLKGCSPTSFGTLHYGDHGMSHVLVTAFNASPYKATSSANNGWQILGVLDVSARRINTPPHMPGLEVNQGAVSEKLLYDGSLPELT